MLDADRDVDARTVALTEPRGAPIRAGAESAHLADTADDPAAPAVGRIALQVHASTPALGEPTVALHGARASVASRRSVLRRRTHLAASAAAGRVAR